MHCRILPYCLQDRRIKPFFFRQHAILLLLQISQKLSVPFRHLLCYFKTLFSFSFLFCGTDDLSILHLPFSQKLSASLYSCIHQTKFVSCKKYLCFFFFIFVSLRLFTARSRHRPELEFLDINVTKDSCLLGLHAIHSPIYWWI